MSRSTGGEINIDIIPHAYEQQKLAASQTGKNKNIHGEQQDGKYYIWFKESIPGVVDSTMYLDSDAFLYQGVEKRKYRPRLNLYVGAYSFCLVIVIFLLLFSPIITEPLSFLNKENVANAENSKSITARSENLAVAVQNFAQTTQIPSEPADNIVEHVPGRLTKNSLGFRDEKYDVLYIHLPNGMYTIQESSWDSMQKANDRLSSVTPLIGADVKTGVQTVDLGDKGIRYRSMIGEFASLDEAKLTMDLIRNTVQ